VSSRDVTERTQVEEALRKEGEIAAALARVAGVLTDSLDAAVILDHLCRVTTEVLGCIHSTTWLWSRDEKVFVPIAGHVDPPEQWESVRAIRMSREALGPYLALLERDELALLGAAESGGLLGDVLRHYETPVVLCMALRRRGELIGVQTAAHRDPAAGFTPEH